MAADRDEAEEEERSDQEQNEYPEQAPDGRPGRIGRHPACLRPQPLEPGRRTRADPLSVSLVRSPHSGWKSQPWGKDVS